MLSLLLAFTMVFAVACKDDDDANENTAANETATESNEVSSQDARLVGDFALADAVKTFEKESNNAQLENLGVDYSYNKQIYRIEGCGDNKEYKIDIDMDTGEVVKKEAENDSCEVDDFFNFGDAKPVTEAYEIIKDKAPKDFNLADWKLSKDDGKLVYKFEFENPSNDEDVEISIDASSLEVLGSDD